MRRLCTSLVTVAVCAVVSCAPPSRDAQPKPGIGSSYLLVSAGDADGADSDFLAVIDLRSDSPDFGRAIATMPTGMKSSMPHHMEYAMPPAGEFLFLNAHHHEMSMLLDVSNPRALRVAKTFTPPPPLRFPHDYSRTPHATRLVGFLRSEGESIDPEETVTPGNHGGIAEYSADGVLLRQAMAGNAGGKPVRPYAFALLPEIDRLVVTSARRDSRFVRHSGGVRKVLDQSSGAAALRRCPGHRRPGETARSVLPPNAQDLQPPLARPRSAVQPSRPRRRAGRRRGSAGRLSVTAELHAVNSRT